MSPVKSTVSKDIEDKIAAYEPKLTGKWAGKEISADDERAKRTAMRRKALVTAAAKS